MPVGRLERETPEVRIDYQPACEPRTRRARNTAVLRMHVSRKLLVVVFGHPGEDGILALGRSPRRTCTNREHAYL